MKLKIIDLPARVPIKSEIEIFRFPAGKYYLGITLQ